MILETDTRVLLSNDSAIHYDFGIGPLPALSFGTLTLTETELIFKPNVLPWTPGWGRVPISRIVKAEVRPGANAFRRRFVWIIGALIFPMPGILGLPWLPGFWRRAAGATLEVAVQRWWFRTNRVYFVENPEEWVERIDRLIADRSEV